jgi:transcriptional regulator with XRE-family HTH domain
MTATAVYPRRVNRPKTTDFDRVLGARLKAARQASGLTFRATAVFADVSYQQLQKYETGQNRIPLNRLVPLCAELGIPVEVFLRAATEAETAAVTESEPVGEAA